MSWPAAATRGALLGALILAVAAPGATAAVFTVDSTIDAVDAMPGDTHCETVDHACTLRAAVQEANELPGADEINVPAGTYEFSVSGRGDDVAASGDLDVKESLSITGQRARTTIVSAKQIDRLFDARAGQLSLSGLSLIEGRASGASDDTGGAARVNLGATLKLAGVRMSEDSAQADGSALYNAGTLDMTASSVDTVSGDDGITTAGTASLTSSTVTRGELKILGGATTIVNSTLVGGAPRASHALNIAGGSATVTNTILAGRGSGACIGAPPASGGHNLADDGTCALAGPADQSYVDPGLRQDDDSLDTLYFPLWAVGTSHDPPPNTSCDMVLCPRLSRAVDSADPGACPPTDQLGSSRPQGPACDVGAYEAPQADLGLSISSDAATVGVGQPFTLTWTITNLGPTRVGNVLVFPNSFPVTVVSQDVVRPGDGCFIFIGSVCDLRVPLDAGASITRTTTVQADSATPAERTIQATVSADGSLSTPPYDANLANNSASASVSVIAPAAVNPPVQLKRGRCANAGPAGTAVADVLKGTTAGDSIRGLIGNDKLSGLGGDDCLDGGAGNDTLDGGAGNDKLSGGPGDDKLSGGAGKDRLSGGTGNDRLSGGTGVDSLSAGAGDDVVAAADGKRELVDCGKGRDRATVDRVDRVKGCEKVTRRR